ncbi:MAG: hypothetical protein HY554_07095 [Elusimicrobia bacterium]|nr:hypothetical protein [Elusimicrobiota bacterium]
MQPSNSGGLEPRLVVILIFLVPALLAAPADCSARARDSSSLAWDLSLAASRSGRRRIAVVPFHDPVAGPCRAGAVIAERLIEHLLERGVEVVERSQLEGVMREHRLGSTGLVDPLTAKRLGRVLGVEAVISGTVVELRGDRIEVHARLIDVETARVLSASTARVEKDWRDFDTSSVWATIAPPVPFFPGDRGNVDWHDGLNAGPQPAQCDTADGKVVEARARYWALRLREPGFSAAGLRANPGSEIADPRLRQRFYSRLRMWYEEPDIPPLNDSDRVLLARCP